MRSLLAMVVITAALVLGAGVARAATRYHATCNHSGEAWTGPDRDGFEEAKADAEAHERENAGHLAFVAEFEAP
jgi:hypothetical protein